MQRELIRDYLEFTEMKPAQAEALSLIFDQMATKTDVAEINVRIAELESRLTWRIIGAVAFFATITTLLSTFIR